MNIAFLMRLWPIYGGGETVTICLANEFVKRGYSVSIIYFVDNTKENMPFSDDRIKVVRIPDVDCNQYSYDSKKAIYVSGQLKKIVEDSQTRILINQWWPPEYLKTIRQDTGVKLIKCHHTSLYTRSVIDEWSLKNAVKVVSYPLYRWYEKTKQMKIELDCWPSICDKFVFLSPLFLEEYKKMKHKFSVSQLDYAYNPLTYSSFLPIEELHNKQQEVLFVGRILESHKKISRILRSWHKIQADNKYQDWKLTIVGDGRDRLKLEKKASKLKLKNVSFEGYQLPLSYYKRASIFVMTSAYEGWGMTLVEAQQNGVVPIVMDTFQPVHEIIQNGENGIIIPDGDVDTFTKELIKLMDSREYRERMAINGLDTCRVFSVENVVDRWELILVDLLKH